MEVSVVHARSGKTLTTLSALSPSSTVADVKRIYHQRNAKYYPDRQSFRSEPKGRSLKDDATLQSLNIKNGDKLYFKDLGPQIGWKTVFLAEYAGPLFVYLLLYTRPACIYGAGAVDKPRQQVVYLAAACWSLHYMKRLLETQFVHRFSHGTMPIMNLFKNCSYYWGFAGFVAYYVNHPLYTSPAFGDIQVYAGLIGFLLNEYGNFSIHLTLRNLRPEGSKERKIPYPTGDPMTLMFNFVSCPNYTYEVGAWACFTLMTQCVPAALFTLAGFYQMAVWAKGKHRNYKREFSNYPRQRKCIIPFVL
ncbi:putative very-long-chain enoyl-CoA reductase art-1 [Saccoglossus kowalevskii]|uniref:very-long-chain enoyl-CoA reductase n=1 Tax=Saccoglossus kowalevskii TaxID=10224 RepID=A0ABM0GL80_SACKO|nr:PREDICTED: probable very-long-chain enoyl-CoA reductase art-1-like [Saccoglossus kowalevskii]